ncbi:MAG TPA: hypothetical protein VD794_12100 [Flavisolibacter sp.]|nr:hypothetical protein [Flavisolibacter sp.]
MSELNHTPQGNETIEMRLWDYIDGIADDSERAAVEQLIAQHTEWRAKYHELLDVHQLVQTTELEEPSMRFSKNVMEEIAKYHIAPATKNYINQKIIWGIVAFFITVIVGFVIYGISQVNWSAGTTSNGIGIDFTRVDYSSMFNNSLVNGFMVLNIILGLMLFDRYLDMKKNQYRNQVNG